MSDKKETAEQANRATQDAVPCLGDYGIGCGVEHSPRCPATYRKAVAAAIEAAVAERQRSNQDLMNRALLQFSVK